MYWEEGYYWQEEDFERRWCLNCQSGSCEEGDALDIQKCADGSDEQRFIYEEVPGSGGGRIKPFTRQDLCWTSLGDDRSGHELTPCDLNCRQIILGLQYEGRFEMNPNGRINDCLVQHHHPKKGEVVHANDCVSSRGDTTSFWVMINKEGTGVEQKEEEVLQGSTTIMNLGKNICTDKNKCGLCIGHCESDADCRDGLVCMLRTGNEYVPGCTDNDLEGNSKLAFVLCRCCSFIGKLELILLVQFLLPCSSR